MIETKTMFGVAAVGVSAVVGYGLYKYVRGKQEAQKIKEAINDMVWFQNFHDLSLWLQPYLSHIPYCFMQEIDFVASKLGVAFAAMP